jgi:hypothetical protein
MKNAVFRELTSCGFFRGVFRLLVTANVVPPPPWPLVRKRTIPTERPPLVDEI